MNVRAIAIILACAWSPNALTADDLSEARNTACLGLAKVAMIAVKAREDGHSLADVKKAIPKNVAKIAVAAASDVITLAYEMRELDAAQVGLVVYTACSVATMEP